MQGWSNIQEYLSFFTLIRPNISIGQVNTALGKCAEMEKKKKKNGNDACNYKKIEKIKFQHVYLFHWSIFTFSIFPRLTSLLINDCFVKIFLVILHFIILFRDV